MNEVSVKDDDIFEQVQAKGTDLLITARNYAVVIKDDETFKRAAEFRKQLNVWKKEAKDKLEPARIKTYQAYQEVLGLIGEAVHPIDEAMGLLDEKLSAYKTEQERLAQIERERLRAEAIKAQEEAKLMAAEEADKSGDHQRADAILGAPVIAPVASMPETVKVEGMSFRETWKVDPVIDLMKLVQGVASGQIPLIAVQANIPFLNQVARSMKGLMNYPGVKAVCEKVVATRTK